MVQAKLNIGALLFALATSSIAEPSFPRFQVRQSSPAPPTCGSLIGQVGQSNGGRKVGIVVDASGSMSFNDPDDLRLVAAKALDSTLISQSGGGKSADLVTVVKFNNRADLIYPLGNPTGAPAVIDTIGSNSGTFIGGGIKAATDELTKGGNDPTANRTGIVVLTDGLDDPSSLVSGTVSEINRAGSLGIRVSFGFLSTDASSQDPNILNAVFKTGGTFTSFDDAASQEAFIAQVLLQGLTGLDAKGGTGISLLPGLNTASQLSQTGGSTFTYGAKAGENLQFNISAITDIDLKATLRDVKGGTDINSTTTNSRGDAVLKYSATADIELGLIVAAAGTNNSGIFSVGLGSSLRICTNGTLTTNNSTNTTTPTTPSSSPTNVPFTAAGSLTGGSLSTVVVTIFGLIAVGILL